MKRPPFLFLENVDRLLKSPAHQRGRDFAVMLATLADLGYEVEWRVVNAADYGFPQKRRRVYIVGPAGRPARPTRTRCSIAARSRGHCRWLGRTDWASCRVVHAPGRPGRRLRDLRRAPRRDAVPERRLHVPPPGLDPDLHAGLGGSADHPRGHPRAGRRCAGGLLRVRAASWPSWRYLKGAKREQRVHKGSGTAYEYAEGAIPFPDPTDGPSRTILTGEGGATPSRFKHVVAAGDGRYRRLTPRELERLNGFPDDWTDTGMPEGRRAFMMGNALVVGVVERIGRELARGVAVRCDRGC